MNCLQIKKIKKLKNELLKLKTELENWKKWTNETENWNWKLKKEWNWTRTKLNKQNWMNKTERTKLKEQNWTNIRCLFSFVRSVLFFQFCSFICSVFSFSHRPLAVAGNILGRINPGRGLLQLLSPVATNTRVQDWWSKTGDRESSECIIWKISWDPRSGHLKI